MTTIEIRPRFQKSVNLVQKDILNRFQEALDSEVIPVRGYIVDHHIVLKVLEEDRHFWSPQLDLEIEEQEEGCLIKGLFGPHPSVWFLFVFFYAFLGFVSLVVMVMGFSQLNLGMSARILWFLPLAGIIFLLVFSSAKTGQRLGRAQMHQLYEFFQKTIAS